MALTRPRQPPAADYGSLSVQVRRDVLSSRRLGRWRARWRARSRARPAFVGGLCLLSTASLPTAHPAHEQATHTQTTRLAGAQFLSRRAEAAPRRRHQARRLRRPGDRSRGDFAAAAFPGGENSGMSRMPSSKGTSVTSSGSKPGPTTPVFSHRRERPGQVGPPSAMI